MNPPRVRTHPAVTRRMEEIKQERLRQTQAQTASGRHAFEKLQGFRGKISDADRQVMARALYWELEYFYSLHPDEERYIILKDAGLTSDNSTKVAHRLVLKPGADPEAVNLYATPVKYQWLIEALARRSGGIDVGGIAYRVLDGTSFAHESAPAAGAKASEANLILEALQEAALRIDEEFQLHEKCLEIAEWRSRFEGPYWSEAERTGHRPDLGAWQSLCPELTVSQPDWPQDWPASSRRFEGENGLWWPLEEWRLEYSSTESDTATGKPRNAFWARTDEPLDPWSATVCADERFLYFPHAYLGPAVSERYSGENGLVPEAYEALKDPPSPKITWDPELCQYRLTEDAYDDELGNIVNWWLVLYPDPQLKQLVPMLFSIGASRGAELLPLSPALIASFGNQATWQYFGREGGTLLQRLRVMTGYNTGHVEVYDQWRETAARFDYNPVLRSRPELVEGIRYRSQLRRWIRERGRRRPSESE